MNVKEASPGTPADGAEQDPDGFYAAGWAARGDLPEAERDAALAEGRLLRERVSRQRQTIESLRRRETLGRTGRLLERIAEIAAPGGAVGVAGAPCACLERPPGGEPVRGRWIPWVRPR